MRQWVGNNRFQTELNMWHLKAEGSRKHGRSGWSWPHCGLCRCVKDFVFVFNLSESPLKYFNQNGVRFA